LSNWTLNEVRERNNRIANTLESMLVQLKDNVTSLTVSTREHIPQEMIQSINQNVQSFNDVLSEVSTVRVESVDRNNATTWAMVLANLTNTVLSNYGNATGASFDLTNMSNMVGIEGMQRGQTNNMTMMSNKDQMQMSGSSNNTMMAANSTSMSNMTTTIVNAAAYQSAQYLANNTILRLFNDTLKPLTMNASNTIGNNTTSTAQVAQGNLTADNNMTLRVNDLETHLLQLRDDINSKASPSEVMMTVHVGIHPLLIQLYGLTIEHDGEGGAHQAMGQ
jgi:hypothetical protein